MKHKEEIYNGNKLIAEFLGAENHGFFHMFPEPIGYREEYDEDGYVSRGAQRDWRVNDMLFHSDWNWLMVIIDKIENIREKTPFDYLLDGYTVIIQRSGCTIQSDMENAAYRRKYNQTVWDGNSTKIEATFKSVVNFINWYNNKEKNEIQN